MSDQTTQTPQAHVGRRPGRPKELYSGDLPVRQMEDVGDGVTLDTLEPEVIVTDENLAAKEYLDELKFMEEPVTIVLHRGREKHAPEYHDFYVNGQAVWVKVDTPTVLKRKFVEVMARAQPVSIETKSHAIEEDESAATINRAIRSLSAQFPFSVVNDPNPKGAAWLAQVMRSN